MHPGLRLASAIVAGLTLSFALPNSSHAQKRAMTVDDLLAVKSVSDPQVSPDGKRVAYVVAEIDRAAGKSNSSLWMVPTEGGEPIRLTTTPGANNHPRWSPDGKTLAFVSGRGGSAQVWLLPIGGGEARVLTRLPIDASGPLWSPKGDKILFAGEVYPGKTPAQTAARDKERESSPSKARIYDRLMVRHWAGWDEGKVNHLFVADVKTGEAMDLTPKLEVNAPPGPFGGSTDYAWSPDGREIAFTAEPTDDGAKPAKNLAWSTNTDIWTVPVAGGTARNVTKANKGADAQPAYHPTQPGLIAYVSQARPGFESDRWVLKAIQTGGTDASFDLSAALDRPVQAFSWFGPGEVIAVTDDDGSTALQQIKVATGAGGSAKGEIGKVILGDGVNNSVSIAPDGSTIAFLRGDASKPNEVYVARHGVEGIKALTKHNAALVDGLDVHRAEAFTFKGADGDKVSGWLVKPPGFDPEKKYPVVFLIHGGPQGAWHDEWHARWNYQMFASPGFAVVAINPRGSTGYGQKFTDQISQDWTGRVYDDLILGLDHALKTYPFLDGDKAAAAGGSYGGFMANWMLGHTDRFKAIISHAGVFDLTSKYGTTEELWFPEWEFGGTPWDRPEHYLEHSPSRYVKAFKTPTLITHGALDFRVPEAQGLGLFTALQRQGVASRLVLFPDEGHWILKPANRVVWWNEMLGWLKTYLK